MAVSSILVPILVFGVIFVNGWTDAPNAIATAVGSGALTFSRAAALASVCNFAGALISFLLFPAVADTVGSLVSFSRPDQALTALCAAMLSIVIWATAAWRFGLPTSESHALLAGLSGSALAIGQGAALNGGAWLKTALGMVLSLLTGFGCARVLSRLLRRCVRACMWQRWAAGVMAFVHGAQDCQKFLALLLLTRTLGGSPSSSPLPLLCLTAVVMALGTALGGRPIVAKVGSDLADLTPQDGLSADLGAGVVLLCCCLIGAPVSTTHAKVAAICGATKHTNLRVAKEIGGAWLLTFPCCGLLSFLITLLMK